MSRKILSRLKAQRTCTVPPSMTALRFSTANGTGGRTVGRDACGLLNTVGRVAACVWFYSMSGKTDNDIGLKRTIETIKNRKGSKTFTVIENQNSFI